MLAFGSGDPTKAICSTLVAQAFHSIRYPILPMLMEEYESTVDTNEIPKKQMRMKDDQLLAKRHFSHFTPRDFDLSPYFEVIKPTITAGFDYQQIEWADDD